MSISLAGKKVLVTGSTDGLGYRLVCELSKYGAQVFVHGRDQVKVDGVVKELRELYPDSRVLGIVCDLNVLGQVENSFGGVQNLDILINNAGVWQEGETKNTASNKIIELVNVNLGAPLVLTKTLLPILTKADFAQILNVVSIAGVEIPSGFYHSIYSATKFGLQAFSEALAKEYDNKNMRIMGYYPGGMETDLFKKAGLNYQKHEPWMFDVQESVDAIIFMLTRDAKINIKRMDLINHLQK